MWRNSASSSEAPAPPAYISQTLTRFSRQVDRAASLVEIRLRAEEGSRIPRADAVEARLMQGSAQLARGPASLPDTLLPADPMAFLAQEPLHVRPTLVAGAVVPAVHH